MVETHKTTYNIAQASEPGDNNHTLGAVVHVTFN